MCMRSLAALLTSGGDRVHVDVKRAKELYERAIDLGQHARAPVELANLLKNNGFGWKRKVEIDDIYFRKQNKINK